jgi:hypothetical protein
MTRGVHLSGKKKERKEKQCCAVHGIWAGMACTLGRARVRELAWPLLWPIGHFLISFSDFFSRKRFRTSI